MYVCFSICILIRHLLYIKREVLGSHGREKIDVGLLGCDAESVCRWMHLFRRNVALQTQVPHKR